MIREHLIAICDNHCGRTREFNGFTRKEVERELQKKGWIQTGPDTHICSQCIDSGQIIGSLDTGDAFGHVIVRGKCNNNVEQGDSIGNETGQGHNLPQR